MFILEFTVTMLPFVLFYFSIKKDNKKIKYFSVIYLMIVLLIYEPVVVSVLLITSLLIYLTYQAYKRHYNKLVFVGIAAMIVYFSYLRVVVYKVWPHFGR
jgi:D-alanyl-lipoteichoic acid acyltransferase DltB (MBOAT superfamily)